MKTSFCFDVETTGITNAMRALDGDTIHVAKLLSAAGFDVNVLAADMAFRAEGGDDVRFVVQKYVKRICEAYETACSLSKKGYKIDA
jgi:hypothetical protein